MGLDMYLEGKKYARFNSKTIAKENGFPLKEKVLEIGYWRKHPNLHGYIVRQFADGVDNCQPIPLNASAIQETIEAIKAKKLPHTEGFFFGTSSDHFAKEDIKTLQKALKWLETEDEKFHRSVIYQASW